MRCMRWRIPHGCIQLSCKQQQALRWLDNACMLHAFSAAAAAAAARRWQQHGSSSSSSARRQTM